MSSPSTIHPAIVQLYAARGRWQKANSLAPWAPDAVEHLSDGFSGDSQRFVWDRVWPENYWLAADDVGSGPNRGDRRSVIRLFDGHDDLVRRIELVAYRSAGCDLVVRSAPARVSLPPPSEGTQSHTSYELSRSDRQIP